VEISASTALCGILLHPAGHTRSPAMHNAAYAALSLDAVYVACDVAPDDLPGALRGALALGFRQLAISLPHKEAVIPLLDQVTDTARRIGAVNTLTRRGDGWLGDNTDWIGIVRALERETPLDGRQAVILGAGGTAHAAAFALRERGAHVTILNRTPARAQALADDLGAVAGGSLRELERLPYDVLVNTTSVGMRTDESPVPATHLRPGSVVLDAVYDPAETRLLRAAAERGARPVGGKWMLVEQALEQIRLWTGKEVPAQVLERAFDAAGRQAP